MQKFGFILVAVAVLALGIAASRAEPLGVAPAPLRAAMEAASPVEPAAACREKRWGWHGWGWYPCKEQVNTCEKCKWRWGYKYCWKVC